MGRDDLAHFLTYGASPRASINLVLTARALAFLRGRDYTLPDDVRDLALDVLRHRVLSYEALAEDLSADDLLLPIVEAVPRPRASPTSTSSHGSDRDQGPERLLRRLEWRVDAGGLTACSRATTAASSAGWGSTSGPARVRAGR